MNTAGIKVVVIVLLLWALAVPVCAMNETGFNGIAWQKALGGLLDDEAYSIQQTADGGYIVAGYSFSNDGNVTGNHGDADYWVVKITAAGTLDWQKCLGGLYDDKATSVQQTADGGYIVAGYSFSNDGNVTGNHGDADYWVVKLTPAGSIEWQRCLGGSGVDEAFSVQQTADGGYIVAGVTSSNDGDVAGNHGSYDYWVVKLDSTGTILWQRSLGGSSGDYAFSIQQTSDGGYIVAGYTVSNDGNVDGNHGSSDYWVVKLDSAGTILWQKCLGGLWGDSAVSIQQTSDGGYIVAGDTNSNDGNVTGNHGLNDYWVVKLDSAGTILWQKCLGGLINDYATSVRQTADGGYIVAGKSWSNDGNVTGNHGMYDYWVVKLNPEIRAAFSAEPTSGTAPLMVSFADRSITSAGVSKWFWAFGDGNVSTDEKPDFTYSIPGDYMVALYITDVNGYNASTYVTNFIHVNAPPQTSEPPLPEPPSIPLSAGWNFVSTPLALAAGQNNASAVFGGVNTMGHSLYLYNASRGSWDQVMAGTVIKPLDGIWVYSDQTIDVPLQFSTDPFEPIPDKKLYTGWNAIGFTGQLSASALTTLSNIDSYWLRAISFNGTTQRFDYPIAKGDTSPLYGQDRLMYPTYGYWLLVNSNVTLAAFGI